jgi:uncharacterized protein (DUF1778 family)
MADIYIRANTSTDDIRHQLSEFSWFSHVEARIEQGGQGNIIVLHEVTLGERLQKFILQSAEERAKSVVDSRKVLNQLVNKQPAFRALLDASVNHKSAWGGRELHKALAGGLSRLSRSDCGKGLAVPPAIRGKLGVANAKMTDIEADTKVSWTGTPAKNSDPIIWRRPDEKQPVVEVTVPDLPDEKQMLHAYRLALGEATGHVVITPIRDIDVPIKSVRELRDGNGYGNVQCCTDSSLNLLLQAIDEAQKTNPNLKAVTIAAHDYAEKGMASRIEELHASRKLAAEENLGKTERGRFYPPHGRQAPGLSGIHFLTNSPFDLQAGKTIVPLSVARSGGYDYVEEYLATDLPALDTGRLIALNDDGLDQPASINPETFGLRFSALLAKINGSIVICPPHADPLLLEVMMAAVIKASENNPWLSVSFATSNKALQAALSNAYINAKDQARELDIDGDDDDLVIPTELWKTV